MSKIITKRIIPILLLVMLCIGMFPTAFAEAEITIADTSASTQIEVVQDSSGADITVVPNEDAGDLITDEEPDSAPVDESSSSGAESSSADSAEAPTPSSSEASASSSAVSGSATSSSSVTVIIPDSSSISSTPAVSAGESETIPEETGTEDEKAQVETSVEIVRMDGAPLLSASAVSAGKLSWTKHPGYQYDTSQGLGSVNMQPWPTATINGQIAYCVQPENLDTHGSKPYDPIQYDRLSSTQRYAIGYAMLYGAQDAGNIPFHIATQTIIWEIVHGYMDLESFIATNKTTYNAVIGYNPAAAPYYEKILAQMRSHKEVPSFSHFSSALAPVHKMMGIPGEYKLDLVNTNPNCDLNDFNFTGQASVSFAKDKQVLHVSSAAAISAGTLFSAFKGSVGEPNSLIFWSSTDQVDQIRATADVLDPVPAYFRLSTEDVGEYSIEISKYETGTDLPLAGAEFEVRHSEKGVVGTYTTDGSGKIRVTVPWQGTYIITELTPPANHLLDDEPKKEVVVSTDNKTPGVSFHNDKFAGLKIIKIDATTKAVIPGVTFNIAKKGGGQAQQVTTGADGVALLPNLEPDWYVITEVSCPPNYILDSTPHTAEIKANETCEITLENYAKPSLEITKVDADAPALKLEGATFRIAQRGSKKYQDITTGPDGIARLTGMEPDYYIVTEITAPNGYILSDEEHTVEIVEGKVTTITLSNQKKSSLSILKIDSVTGQPLANATFEIGYKNGETIGRFTSDEDGFVRLPQINPGLIVVTEITAPDGYIIDLREQEVLLNPGEEKTLRFENTPASSVILKKVDMEGNPLAGAMFRLTQMNGELVGEYTTGRNGFVTIPELDPGWYVAVEIKAPDGYKLNDTPQKVELKAGEPAILEFENEELSHLQIYKYDSVTKKPLAGVTIRVEMLNGERIGDFKTNQAGLIAIPNLEPGAYVCYEIATVPGYQLDMTPQTVELDADGRSYVEFANIPLAGLTLQKIDSVTKAGIGGVEFLVTKLDGGEIGTYTTDGDGRIFIPNLEEQYVRMREISVSDGYKIDTAEKIVELKAGEANTVEFENHPYPYLVIYKLGDDGQPLPGVSFKITNDAGRELGAYTTNSAGRIVLTGIDEGHYVVQEVEAAEGYELDATPYDVYLQWGKTSQIKLKNKELGSLSLVKVSAENGKRVLPGASFLLYDEKDNLIGEYTTDENGEILLDHALKAGLYTLKEIKAPDGFVLDDQTQKVEIKNGTTIRLTWPNTPERGRIRIEKVSTEYNDLTKLPAGSPLPDATFEIFTPDDNEVVDTITTDERGIAISRLLPLGLYGVREVSAPEYYLLNDKVIFVELKVHNDLIQLTVEDANEEIEVDVQKTGNVEAMPGDLIRYDFDGICNNSNVPLDEFYWRDILPTDAVTLQEIHTGTWNEDLEYKVLYKTNLSQDYRVLAEGLHTNVDNLIDCKPAVVGLKSGEVITEFRFEFGTVQPGFAPVTKPYIQCFVNPGLPNEYRFRNCTDVGSRRGDEWVIDKDCWVTIIYATPKGKLPKTGS